MSIAKELFATNLGWMAWNLFLAFIPFALSLILFNRQNYNVRNWRKFLWWLGVLAFILFLPNAPYIATDIIHLINDVKEPDITRKGLFFLIIPQYICFLGLGFQFYVLSLTRLCNYLQQRHIINQAIGLELGINLICAVGVYLGRFNRLNSWNVINKPIHLVQTVLDNLESLHFLGFTLVLFGVITLLYYLFKQLNFSQFLS